MVHCKVAFSIPGRPISVRCHREENHEGTHQCGDIQWVEVQCDSHLPFNDGEREVYVQCYLARSHSGSHEGRVNSEGVTPSMRLTWQSHHTSFLDMLLDNVFVETDK
jgi:hypothetical protein